ncbi:hypothetical protein [Gordonia terrae]
MRGEFDLVVGVERPVDDARYAERRGGFRDQDDAHSGGDQCHER